jgi:hypothetical protein
MKATHITLVLLLASLSYPCYSQFAPEGFDDVFSKDAVTRERVAWEAARNKDKAGLAALLSEDFTEITEDGVFDKAQILANLDHLTVTSYSPRNVRVKKLAPDTVMLIVQVTVEGIYDGHNFRAADDRLAQCFQSLYTRCLESLEAWPADSQPAHDDERSEHADADDHRPLGRPERVARCLEQRVPRHVEHGDDEDEHEDAGRHRVSLRAEPGQVPGPERPLRLQIPSGVVLGTG